MNAATTSQRRQEQSRLLIIDREQVTHTRVASLPDAFRAGDVLVVNDAATLPSSLSGQWSGQSIEIRLFEPLELTGFKKWRAILFGAGDWRTPTENRPPAPRVRPGDLFEFRAGLAARVLGVEDEISSRLLKIELIGSQFWSQFYQAARPIQYSYLRLDLALWDQQTIFAGAPIALEPPSASFVLTWDLLFRLRAKGVEIHKLTHGTGLSNTGDHAIDGLLPTRERYQIPGVTAEAILRARQESRRVIAVGTGVVRALESWGGDQTSPGTWHWTDLRLNPNSRLQFADGILTGMHEPGASHLDLLHAFTKQHLLERAYKEAVDRQYLWHEYGDSCLIVSAS